MLLHHSTPQTLIPHHDSSRDGGRAAAKPGVAEREDQTPHWDLSCTFLHIFLSGILPLPRSVAVARSDHVDSNMVGCQFSRESQNQWEMYMTGPPKFAASTMIVHVFASSVSARFPIGVLLSM